MPTKGYDDAENIARVRALMSRDGTTRRQAIIAVVGERNLRRIEMKMRRLDQMLEEDSADVETATVRLLTHAEHAAMFPARLHEDGDDLVFEVLAPDAGPSANPHGTPSEEPGTRFVLHACAGRRQGATVGAATVRGVRAGKPSVDGATDAADIYKAKGGLDALGLSHEIREGMIVPREGTNEVLRRLATALANAWSLGADPVFGLLGQPDEDLYLHAIEMERERLEVAGLGRVRDALDGRALRVLATVDQFEGRYHVTGASEKLDGGPGLGLLDSLTPFLKGALYALDAGEARRFEGRPREMLAKYLRHWTTSPVRAPDGGDVSDAEVDWLFRVFGNKPIPPLSTRAIELLLSQRHAIDEMRAASDVDAAGLASIFRSMADQSYHRSTEVWKLREQAARILGRLNDGPDASLGYGEVTARLRSVGDEPGEGLERFCTDTVADEPLAQAIGWVIRAQDLPFLALDRLVMPSLALAVMQREAVGPAEAEARLRKACNVAFGLFSEQAIGLARDMVGSGLDLAGLAAQGRKAKIHGLEGMPGLGRYGGIVRACPIAEAAGVNWEHPPFVEQEWDSLSALLVRRWRCGGPDLVRTAMADWIKRAGEQGSKRSGPVRDFVGRLRDRWAA